MTPSSRWTVREMEPTVREIANGISEGMLAPAVV